ncbi:MAG: hypothetical protein FJ279_19185 [Planctomycetes bacterium]|nr:hypothetical protein [Planctomycetota bacterium]
MTTILIAIAVLVVLAATPALAGVIRNKSYIWLPSYVRRSVRRAVSVRKQHGPVHVMFCVTDHFEPKFGGVSAEQALARVQRWADEYPRLAKEFVDADGRHPRYTWFYPYHEFEPEHLLKLNALCRAGFGEVEMHLHHGNCARTSAELEKLVQRCLAEYSQFGVFVTAERKPRQTFGFIHGMWALDNADERYCGVNDEISILARAGCYADFGLPAPAELQARQANCIFYATDDPRKPKSHDSGAEVQADGRESGDLMMIPGPIGIDWRASLTRLRPRVDMGEISGALPPSPRRVDLWVRTWIHVSGRPNWVFVKAFAHGAPEESADVLLGPAARAMHEHLQKHCNDGRRFKLHYVTAREAYNIIKAAESGKCGSPGLYRDYIVKPYANTRVPPTMSI